MTTHATITLKTDDQAIHANMLADGYPAGFGETLRALVEASKLNQSEPSLRELREMFFAPVESDPSTTPVSLRALLNRPLELFEPTEEPDQLRDAWYRYEIDEVGSSVRVTAYRKNNGPDGAPSLGHGWGRVFQGSLGDFFAWSQGKTGNEE